MYTAPPWAHARTHKHSLTHIHTQKFSLTLRGWSCHFSLSQRLLYTCIPWSTHRDPLCACVCDSHWLIDDGCRAGGHWVICWYWEVNGWEGNGWKNQGQEGEMKLDCHSCCRSADPAPLKGTLMQGGNRDNVGKGGKAESERVKGQNIVPMRRFEELGHENE